MSEATETETTETTPPGGADAGAGEAETAAAPPANGAGVGQAAARPDWVPEAFWDAGRGQLRPQAKAFVDEKGSAVRLEELFKSYDEARRELNRTKEASKPPKEYSLNIPEDVPVPSWVQGGGPLEDAVLEAARETGIPQKALDGIIRGYLTGAHAALQGEMETLRAESPSEEAHVRRISDLAGRVKAVAGEDEVALATLHAWAGSAAGVRLLEEALDGRLAARAGRYVPVPGAGAGAPAGHADRQARARELMRSDAYRQGDKAVHAQVARLFEEMYPGEQQTAPLNSGFVRD